MIRRCAALLAALLLGLAVSGCAGLIESAIRSAGQRGELVIWSEYPLHAGPRVGDRATAQICSTKVALAGKEVPATSEPYAHWTTEVVNVSPEAVEIRTVNQAGVRTRLVVSPGGDVKSMAFVFEPEVPFTILPTDGSDPRLTRFVVKDAPTDTFIRVPAGRFRVNQILEVETHTKMMKRQTRQVTIVYLSDEVPLREVLRETTVLMEDPAFSWEKILEAATTIYFKNLNATNPRTILESLNAAGAAAKATKDLVITRTELVSFKFAPR